MGWLGWFIWWVDGLIFVRMAGGVGESVYRGLCNCRCRGAYGAMSLGGTRDCSCGGAGKVAERAPVDGEGGGMDGPLYCSPKRRGSSYTKIQEFMLLG